MSAPASKSDLPAMLSYTTDVYGVIASNDWLNAGTWTLLSAVRKRDSWKLIAGHDARSPVAPITRSSWMPSVRVPPSTSRIGATCHGISISTDQPASSSLVAWRQMPSQSVLNWFSLVIVVSMMLLDNSTVKL